MRELNGLILEFDERSKNYPVYTSELYEKKPKTKEWACPQIFHQTGGSCVGYSLAYALLAEPTVANWRIVRGLYPLEEIYWAAQMIDRFPGGEYPGAIPQAGGTSLLAGGKILKELGWIDSYKWAFSMKALKRGVSNVGPAVLGIPWYEGMNKPNAKGFIKPTGQKVGGHAILCVGINVEKGFFWLKNSWGAYWGQSSYCKVSFKHMRRLLIKEKGQCMFLIGQSTMPRVE